MIRNARPIAALTILTIAAFVAPAWAGPMQASPTLEKAFEQPDAWFNGDEAAALANHVATWQNASGGWWKTYDPHTPRPAVLPEPAHDDGPPGDTEADWHRTSTIDNGATYTEIRFLARVNAAQPKPAYARAIERGITFLLQAQYPNGGWPQRFPVEQTYGRHITFNDDAMVNVLRLLRDVADRQSGFAFVDSTMREKCKAAFDRGIECILDCQIKSNGKLTAWCQQHDEQTLAPVGARTFELPSISGNESAGIVLLLMELPSPDERTRNAIDAAMAWFEAVKITGKRVETVTGAQYENGKDRVLVDDPNAPPLWARFYDIETNKPFFASRDGVKRDDYAAISWERRNKYSWFGTWPRKAIEKYGEWKRRANQAK